MPDIRRHRGRGWVASLIGCPRPIVAVKPGGNNLIANADRYGNLPLLDP